MYLGQLAKLRDVLRTSKVHVILDARDEAELQDREGDAGSNENENIAQVEIAEVKITDQVSSYGSYKKAWITSLEGSVANCRQLSR